VLGQDEDERAEVGRKPRPGLKLEGLSQEVVGYHGRSREKTQTGIETLAASSSDYEPASRSREKTQTGIETCFRQRKRVERPPK